MKIYKHFTERPWRPTKSTKVSSNSSMCFCLSCWSNSEINYLMYQFSAGTTQKITHRIQQKFFFCNFAPIWVETVTKKTPWMNHDESWLMAWRGSLHGGDLMGFKSFTPRVFSSHEVRNTWSWNSSVYPPITKMEPNNWWLVDVSHFATGYFQVPC